jgi:hypothetical protein
MAIRTSAEESTMHTAAHIVNRTKWLSAAAPGCRGLAIVAAVLVAGGVTAATPSTAAESSNRDSLFGPQAKGVEVAEPAATVASEAPFQRFFFLECSEFLCTGSLPPVQQKERLVIQFVSCHVGTSGDVALSALVIDRNNRSVAGHLLGAPVTASATTALVSQPILLTVTANRTLDLRVQRHSGNLNSAACGVSGIRQRLN